MFIPDMPNVPPQNMPVMLAQVNQARDKDVTAIRTLGVCHPSPNDRYTLENVVEPIGEASYYLKLYENRKINGPATVTILQQPKHGVFRLVTEADRGKLFSDTSGPINPDDPGYAYLPEKGYLGKDSATVLVDFGGIKVKVVYFLQGISGPLGNTGLDTYCWKHGLYWKISSTIGADDSITFNSIEHIPADISFDTALTSDFATGYLANR